jgi:hypothetical protein
MKKFMLLYFFVLPMLLLAQKKSEAGKVMIIFENVVNDLRLQLDSTTYTNPFNEKYTVSKFKYYISNIYLANGTKIVFEKNSYHLIDEKYDESKTVQINLPVGNYKKICFTLGVDSIKNISGAQTGALDVINDMFWTWNNGYVMLKLEGNSPASNIINNKIEYHIGGFKEPYNAIKKFELALPQFPIVIKKNTIVNFIIQVNVNTLWGNKNEIRFSQSPACTLPGVLAKSIADNYQNIFILKEINYTNN